jgi:hypothetical protein
VRFTSKPGAIFFASGQINLSKLEKNSRKSKMNRSESVGSVNSLFVAMRLSKSPSEENLELKSKLLENQEKLADQEAQIEWYRDTNDRLLHDAARWNFAKAAYAKQLGYDTAEELQKQVDSDMMKPPGPDK